MYERRLGDVLHLTMGQSPPGTTCNSSGIGVPLLNGPTEFGVHHPTPVQWTTGGRRFCNSDAILLCVRGSTTGRTNRSDRRYAIGRGVAAIETDDPIDQVYAYYAIIGSMTSLLERATGSVFPNLSRDDIASLIIPWPSSAVRNRIAHMLGSIDDKIESNRRLIGQLERLISGMWEQFMSEGDDWPVVAIAEVAGIVGGSTPRTSVEAFWDGEFAWVTPRDLSRLSSTPLLATQRTITADGLAQISSGLLPVGTVLLSSRAPIGYVAIAELPVAINQGFIALLPSRRASSLYLWQWVRHHIAEIMERANGTTFLEISKANFRPMPFAIPPGDAMDRWTAQAEDVYRLVVALERETHQLSVLLDSLLPKLISGELRIRDTAPLVEEAV